ncbi:hypothetical protein EVJ50_02035 [Synechococcus sp. RSCCF101]|uniref:anti-sigma factor domain-containing protein n=1 Tax=Synechococcus sp. RSCCF101 TaxID=2511069 RepID=UPI001248B80C|nr:anti-sigma factor [Synechococcus sp. RSCCF101]QEY31211.1 hypothetical protein EVJ50_02035 [Synechococcus sp. RSCCF101]
MTPDSTDPSRTDLGDARLDALLAGHALGDLDEQERGELQAALAADPTLQARLEEFRTTLQLLPLALPRGKAPPSRLRHRLLSEAGSAPGPADRRNRPARTPWLLAGGLALALALLGGDWLSLRERLADADPAPGGGPTVALQPLEGVQRVQRTMTLHPAGAERPPHGMGDTSGSVQVNPGGSHNLLVIEGLPDPPPRHSYRLWALIDGQHVGCVRFVPDGSGRVHLPIPTNPTSQASGVSISIEPLGPVHEVPAGRDVLTSL